MTEPKLLPLVAEPKHAKFSPSGAKRWMNCQGSLTLAAYAPKSEDLTTHNVMGSAVHALAAHCINKDIEPFELEDITWSEVDDWPKEDIKKVGIEQDIIDQRATIIRNAGIFVTHCQGLMDQYQGLEDTEVRLTQDWGCESRVYANTLDENCYGTADFWIYFPSTRTLHIADYKNGFMEVAPDDPQLKIYASAVIQTFQLDVVDVFLTVVQPNTNSNPKTHQMSLGDLRAFEDEVSSIILEYHSYPVQPTNPGTWCKWCKAKPLCVSHQAQADDVDTGIAGAYTDEQLKAANARIPAVKEWIKTIGTMTYNRLMAGGSPTEVGGLLNMSSPHRKFKPVIKDENGTEEKLEDAAKAEFGDRALTTPEVKSPAQIEKIPGGKAFTMKWAYSPPGNLVVAGLDSKKPHVTPMSVKEKLADIAGVTKSS